MHHAPGRRLFSLEFAEGTARHQGDLDGADDAAQVAIVNGLGAGWVQGLQTGEDGFLALASRQFLQLPPQVGLRGHARDLPAFHHGPHVLSRAPHQHGQPPPSQDIRDDRIGQFLILAQADGLVGCADVDEMVGDVPPFLGRYLGRADVHAPVHLSGIRGDDLASQFSGQEQGRGGFSHRGGPDQH